MKTGVWHSLANRLFRLVLLGYVGVVVVLSALEMFWGYRQASVELALQLAEIKSTSEPAVTEAVWTLDRKLLSAMAAGIFQSPAVAGVRIEDQNGALLASAGRAPRVPARQASPGEGPSEPLQTMLMQSTQRGREIIGRLLIYPDTSLIRDQLLDRAMTIALNALVSILVLWAVFRIVLRRGLQEPLQRLADVISRLELSADKTGPIAIDYARNDEVGRLVQVVRKMQQRLAVAHDEVRASNENLASLLHQQSEELRKAHNDLMSSEIAKSRAAERQQIIADMHDGFGVQLSSARILLEQGRLDVKGAAEVLRECMADLYLVVDVLNDEGGDLEQALIDFRSRCERRFRGSDVAITWEIDVAGAPPLEHRLILQILRIIQESLNNAVKHAGGGHISVGVRAGAGELAALVADDGVGMPTCVTPGKGLNNMQKRAREIGARLDFEVSEKGTVVRLRLPLQAGWSSAP